MNKWEITDNEMEGFVKSLFKDEEKYHNVLDNACDLQYDSDVREVFSRKHRLRKFLLWKLFQGRYSKEKDSTD